jgi:hypothetical protein
MRGQLHVPVVLPPSKKPRYPLNRGLGGQQRRCGRFRKVIYRLRLPGIKRTILVSFTSQPSHTPTITPSRLLVIPRPPNRLNLISIHNNSHNKHPVSPLFSVLRAWANGHWTQLYPATSFTFWSGLHPWEFLIKTVRVFRVSRKCSQSISINHTMTSHKP